MAISELRAEGDKESPRLTGYAAVFDVWTDIWFWREKINRGAFTKTIQEADVRALFNHDPNFVLGRNGAGTLRLREDDKGLFVEIDSPSTQTIQDLVVSPIQRGDVSQMSFGFIVVKERMTIKQDDEAGDDISEREILEVKLFDVSPVTFPAYPETSIEANSIPSHEVRRRMFPGMTQAVARNGLDFDALGTVMLKRNQGIDLASADTNLLEASIDVLRGYLPAAETPEVEPEPEPEFHSEDANSTPDEFHLLDADIEATMTEAEVGGYL